MIRYLKTLLAAFSGQACIASEIELQKEWALRDLGHCREVAKGVTDVPTHVALSAGLLLLDANIRGIGTDWKP